MTTTLLLFVMLASEPTPAIEATGTRWPCMSPSVEHPALVLSAPDWGFAPMIRETACDETVSAPVTMLEMDINPFDPANHDDPELGIEEAEAGVNSQVLP